MEVNKEQAERCRDLGAKALQAGNFERAVKMLRKSLQLYPLPGVEALLSHATAEFESSKTSASSSSSSSAQQQRGSQASSSAEAAAAASNGRSSRTRTSATAASAGSDGRAYTEEQTRIVQEVLRAKEGGRGAHYRVLKLQQNCTEAEIKKAYRKLSLKVHPDKNSAPHADEAFKAVGLAYATLSDSQKRTIYDRYGDEDPDNRGGGMRGGGMHMRPGQEVSPEEIFNMFFGGGMPGMYGGGPGFHVYTNGFGPGMQFRAARNRRQQQPRGDQYRGREEQQQAPGIGMLLQFLPILVIMLLSFFRYDENVPTSGSMPGEGKYFSMVRKTPFIHPQKTRLSTVKDIPYFVSDRFLRTYNRDRYQLAQVERMVERAYEQYLVDICAKQRNYKKQLVEDAEKESNAEEKAQKRKLASDFELSRCLELAELYPNRKRKDKQRF